MSDQRPINPHLVLLAAALLPGCGHVLLNLAQRGLMFIFFIVVFAWASHHLMPDHASFIGKNIGGIFVYGISILDAYKVARVRMAVWNHENNSRS